jgi:chaperonin cofactor prefoldin
MTTDQPTPRTTATPRTDAALYPMNGVDIVWPEFARILETELAETERLRFGADADRRRLRAEVERLTAKIGNQADRIRYLEGATNHATGTPLSQAIARAEKAEAELADWSVLNLWGGTPEIVHEFIKGQQTRIHHCQDLEAELTALAAERDSLRAELADEKNLHTQTRTVVEELNTICTDLRNAGGPPFIRSEAIRLLREDQVTLRAEVERLKKQIKDDNRSYGCELRDPNGTIWEQAAKDHARACAERAYVERLKKQIREDNLGYACEL